MFQLKSSTITFGLKIGVLDSRPAAAIRRREGSTGFENQNSTSPEFLDDPDSTH